MPCSPAGMQAAPFRLPAGPLSGRQYGNAFFRQDLALLPATLPDALRANSAALLTDFAAQDYTLLGTVLEFLANNSALPHAEALPGAWDAKAGTYTVTDASRAAVQTFLSVSPASGNDASLREP